MEHEHETARVAFFRRYVVGTLAVLSNIDLALACDPHAVASWAMASVFGMEAKLGDFYFEVALPVAREEIAAWKAMNSKQN